MPFRSPTVTADRIVYLAPASAAPWVGWAVGFGLLSVAVVLNRLDPSLSNTGLVITQWLFLLLAGFVLAILIFQPYGPHLVPPAAVVFDRVKGVMEIHETSSMKGRKVVIALTDIAFAGIDEQERTSRNNDKEIDYHLFVELTSGGRWYLQSQRFRKAIDEELAQLRSLIANAAASTESIRYSPPPGWKLTATNNETLVTWTNKVEGRPWRLAVRTILYLSSFTAFAMLVHSQNTFNESVVLFLVFLPVVGLFGWLLFRGYKRLWRDMRTRFALRLNATGVDYYEFAKEGGTQRHHVHLPNATIRNIRFNFSPQRGLPHDIEITTTTDDKLIIPTDLSPLERQMAVGWMREEVGRWGSVS